ncbi:MAG: flagellar hook-basal body complex protein FliE [Balneolaceae bacterium]|nr:MAG: flagellar hook-basal body complex protein FliE [Balneolaceae bacterium]
MDISPVQPGFIKPLQSAEVFRQPIKIKNDTDNHFSGLLKQAINSVDQAQKTADRNMEDFVMGKTENVHEVMISMERAKLSFHLLMEVRNKVIETYQELSRMHI